MRGDADVLPVQPRHLLPELEPLQLDELAQLALLLRPELRAALRLHHRRALRPSSETLRGGRETS